MRQFLFIFFFFANQTKSGEKITNSNEIHNEQFKFLFIFNFINILLSKFYFLNQLFFSIRKNKTKHFLFFIFIIFLRVIILSL